MTPNRPYLIRALYEWICDNDCTPYLLVDATLKDAQVPPASVTDGRIVLNISPSAVRHLDMGNEHILFNARFGGRDTSIRVPVAGVMAIYARETQEGMSFGQTPEGTASVPPEPAGQGQSGDDDEPPPRPGGGHLKVVK